jgi:glutamate-1-semialdehyde 2,1-aminomutase
MEPVLRQPHKKSRAAWIEAQAVLPGGVDSPVRSFQAIGITPPFIARGEGAFLVDLDGNRYLDFCQSWGASILGHARREVTAAAGAALKNGSSFGAATLGETKLANLIREAIPAMERIRFVSSGTEAVMSALRLARAFTGRMKIIKVDGGYHGHADAMLVTAGSGLAGWSKPSSAGVPRSLAQETLSIPFNDSAALDKAFQKFPQGIAAVIIEPVPANMGVVPPAPGFLQTVRMLTKRYRSLLILDEVITGFRLDYGGAQKQFEIEPDLTCLGKIIGGGFPVGAFGGRKEIMSLLAPLGPVYQAGTLSGNPVAMAAGIATLNYLKENKVHAQLNGRSRKFIRELRQLAGKEVTINAVDSMFTLFFTNEAVTDYGRAKKIDVGRFAAFYRQVLKKGVYLSPSPFEANFISCAHSERDLKAALRSIAEAVRETANLKNLKNKT